MRWGRPLVAFALLIVGCGGDPPPADEPQAVISEPTGRQRSTPDPDDERRIRELQARARREGRENRARQAAEEASEAGAPGEAEDGQAPPPPGRRRVPANVRPGDLQGFRLQNVQVYEDAGEWLVSARVANRTSKAWKEAVFLVRLVDRNQAPLGQVRLRIEWPPTDGAWRDVESARVAARGELSLVRVAFDRGSAVESDDEEGVAVPFEMEGAGGFRFLDRKVTRGDREYWRLRCRLATTRHEWALVRFKVEWFDHKGRLVHTGRIVADALRKGTERKVEVQGPDYRYRVRKIRIRFDGGE